MNHRSSLTRKTAAVLGCLLIGTVAAAHAQNDVWTQHNDNARGGDNGSESVLTASNVNSNQFGMLFKDPVDDQVYAQPLVTRSINIGGGTHDVAFIATTNNSVYAFDANTGVQYWHVNFGTAATVQNLGLGCQDMVGTVGIVGTPVIDAGKDSLWVVDQLYNGGNYTHQLHRIHLSTGADYAGSPVTVSNPAFNSKMELQRTGLLYSGGNIYFAFSSHCDQGAWKGFVFGYNGTSLAQIGEFNDSPNANGGAIWQSGNAPAADGAGSVYVVSGNGHWDGTTDFSETMLKLSGSNLSLQDWHTPSNYGTLDGCDCDLTTSGAVLLPNNEVLAGGKGGAFHIVHQGSMGHLGDGSAIQTWQASSSHIHSLVFFNNELYMWGQSDFLQRFDFNGTTFNTNPSFKGTQRAIGHPGASLSLSSNGYNAGTGILWAATNSADSGDGGGAWHGTVPGILYAYNISNMGHIYDTNQNANRDNCGDYAKFAAPSVANGKVYLPSFGSHATGSGALCVYGELSSTTNLIPNGTYEFVNVNSGLALESPGWDHTQGLDTDQWTVNGGGNQLWSVINLGNNVITLTNNYSADLLDVAGNSTANGALIDQWPYNGQTNQQWKVISLGGGQYELTSVKSGLALEVVGGGTGTGVHVDQWPYGGNAWQKWTISAHHP